MKVHIFSNGDPSAGINGNEAIIDFPYMDKEHWGDKEDLENVRITLAQSFSELFDGKVTVTFEDEIEKQEKEIADIYLNEESFDQMKKFDGMIRKNIKKEY